METLLRGSPAADEARRSRASVRSDYELITKQPGQWPSFERFDWAFAMVSSRCFTLQTELGDIDALVPIADMLNHARPRETAYRVVEQEEAGGGSRAEGGTASFEMRMLRPMARGRAVHDTYGAKGNEQLLLTYAVAVIASLAGVGFVVITIATQSPRLAGVCLLTVLNVVGSFTGMMVWFFGMEPGMIGACPP